MLLMFCKNANIFLQNPFKNKSSEIKSANRTLCENPKLLSGSKSWITSEWKLGIVKLQRRIFIAVIKANAKLWHPQKSLSDETTTKYLHCYRITHEHTLTIVMFRHLSLQASNQVLKFIILIQKK